MTKLEAARQIVNGLGFTLKSVSGEYRLCPKGKSEDVAYYTDDLEDAVATARNWR